MFQLLTRHCFIVFLLRPVWVHTSLLASISTSSSPSSASSSSPNQARRNVGSMGREYSETLTTLDSSTNPTKITNMIQDKNNQLPTKQVNTKKMIFPLKDRKNMMKNDYEWSEKNETAFPREWMWLCPTRLLRLQFFSPENNPTWQPAPPIASLKIIDDCYWQETGHVFFGGLYDREIRNYPRFQAELHLEPSASSGASSTWLDTPCLPNLTHSTTFKVIAFKSLKRWLSKWLHIKKHTFGGYILFLVICVEAVVIIQVILATSVMSFNIQYQ